MGDFNYAYRGSLQTTRSDVTGRLGWKIKDIVVNDNGRIISSKIHWSVSFTGDGAGGTLGASDRVEVQYGFTNASITQVLLSSGQTYSSLEVDSNSFNYPGFDQSNTLVIKFLIYKYEGSASSEGSYSLCFYNDATFSNLPNTDVKFEINPESIGPDSELVSASCIPQFRSSQTLHFSSAGIYLGYKIADSAEGAIPLGHNDTSGFFINSTLINREQLNKDLEDCSITFSPALNSGTYAGKYIRIFAEAKNDVDDVFNAVIYSDAFMLGAPDSIDPPVLDKSSYTVDKNAQTVTINVTSNYNIYYALSKTALKNERQLIPLNKTFDISDLSPNSSKKFYFWARAGSTETWSENHSEVTVFKNATEGIGSLTGNVISYNFNGSNGADGNLLSWANFVKDITVSVTGIGTLTRTLEMIGVNDLSSVDWTSGSVKTTTNSYEIAGQTSNYSLGNMDIDALAATAFNDNFSTYKYYAWRLKCVFGGSTMYLPNTTGKFYAIAGYGGQTYTKYNQFSNSNISGTIAGNMYDKVRIIIPYDGSVGETYTINVISNVTNIAYTCVTSKNPSTGTTTSRNFDITLTNPETITSGAQINFTFTFTRNTFSKQVTVTMNSCKKPNSMTTFSHGAKVIKPFTVTGTCTLEMGYPFGSVALADVPTQYEAAALSTSLIMRYHATNDYNRTFTETETLSKSGDNLSITCNRADLFPWPGPNDTPNPAAWTGLSHYVGILSYTAQLVFTNLYGAVFTTNTENCQFNFNEKPASVGLGSLKYKSSSSASSYDKTFNTSNTYAQENLLLQFNLNIGLHTYDDLRIKVYRNSTLVKTLDKSKSELSFPTTGQNAIINSISVNLNGLDPILDTNTIIWKVEVYNSSGYIYNNAITATSVVQQGAARITLNSLTYAEDIAYYSFTVSSLGYSVPRDATITASYKIMEESSTTPLAIIPSSEITLNVAKTGQVSIASGSWLTKTIRVVQETTVDAHTEFAPYVPLTNTKQVSSNSRIIYKASPTVAYRKHQLGINTSSPASDAVVDIRAIDEKNCVRLSAYDSYGSPVTWKISTSDGAIECTHFDTTLSVYSQRRINMLTGLMNNSWRPPLESGYYAYADGTKNSSTTYCRTETLWAGDGAVKSVTLHGTTYQFAVAYYDASGTYLGHSNYGRGTVYIPSTAIKFGVSFRIDGQQNLTSSDFSAIIELLEVNYDSLFPSCPSDDGNYVLKCEVTNSGVGNFSWTANAPGPSGTSDYNELTNKPKIEGETLSGDKEFSDLHLVAISSNEINIIMSN